METILWYIAVGCITVGIAINLVLPVAWYFRYRRLAASSRLRAIKSLFGHHYQCRAFLMCDKR